MSIPAGWYADSTTPGRLRWWDGTQWTDHVAPAAPAAPVAPAATEATVTQASPQVQATQAYPPVETQAHPQVQATQAYPSVQTTQTTRNFDYAPAAKPKRTGLWIGLGAGALVIILLIGAGVFFVGARLLGTLAEGAEQSDQSGQTPFDPGTGSGTDGTDGGDGDAQFGDVSAQLMNPLLPAGFDVDPDNPLAGEDTAGSLWDFYVTVPTDPVDCTPLTVYPPLAATDSGSTDVVTDLGSWVNGEVSSSLSAEVRRFETEDAADSLLDATETTVETCAAGYSGEGFVSNSVTATDLAFLPESVDGESWIEDGANTSESDEVQPWIFEVADIQRGNLVVRGTCFQSADTADPAVCSEFFASLAADLDSL